MDYQCCYCSQQYTDFSLIVQHTTENHSHEYLKIRVLIVDPKSGKKTLQTHNYNIMPAHLKKDGKLFIGLEDRKIKLIDIEPHPSNQSTPDQTTDESSDFTFVFKQIEDYSKFVAQEFQKRGLLSFWLIFHELVASG
jgi:hypothetical protein